jgi:hypothetical protein
MAQAVSRRPLAVAAQGNPVGFVVDKVALGQAFLQVFWFSPVNIIPPWAPHIRKFKKIVLSLVHSFIHSLNHSHPGMNKMPTKAAAVQFITKSS